jgi:hypothetical protein
MTYREQATQNIIQQVSNEIEDTLLHHAPLQWQDEALEAIEEEVLRHTRFILDAIATSELNWPGALRLHIANGVADTKRLIHERISKMKKI